MCFEQEHHNLVRRFFLLLWRYDAWHIFSQLLLGNVTTSLDNGNQAFGQCSGDQVRWCADVGCIAQQQLDNLDRCLSTFSATSCSNVQWSLSTASLGRVEWRSDAIKDLARCLPVMEQLGNSGGVAKQARVAKVLAIESCQELVVDTTSRRGQYMLW
jgi:hypothetical protein